MTDERKELIERWAREAGAIGGIEKIMDRSALSRFAELVRADALEEAAKVCEQQAGEPECPERAAYCADAIRKMIQAP